MPPKSSARGLGPARPAQQTKSYLRTAVDEVTSVENRSVVGAVAFFAVRVPCVLI